MSQAVDSRVSREWAKRPNDERFLSLVELHDHCKNRADNARIANVETSALKAYGTEEGELLLNTELGPKFFTNWSFGQVSGVAGGPAGYLKKLSAPLAAACINEGLVKADRSESMIMANGGDKLRCITSTQYGRIWDHEVVKSVMQVTEGGSWKIPAASYATTDPLRATTLYASDRDVFLFLVDEAHPIEVPGMQPMFRGFYAWNSEVGAQVFGLAAFLYERVCDNRNIWGVSHRMELRIRHSSGAPERFLQEGRKTLLEYSNESSAPIVERITRAQNIKLGKDEDEVRAFLRKNGMTLSQADLSLNQVKQDGKDILNAWEVTRGITAAARAIPHTDTRIGVERIAGKILDAVV